MTASIPNRLLHVDLTRSSIAWEDVSEAWQQDYIGGKGLGARYLYEHVDPGTDPLSPANVLLLVIGPLTGYLPDGGRFAAVTKSPLTGLFLDSYAGGSFGPSLRAGYPNATGIMVTGARDSTCYLDLRDGNPSLEDCPDLAHARTDEVDEHFSDASVLCVGPAGEAAVSFATIAVDGGEHHAGRGGAGAVMGGKGLKAVILDRATPEVSKSSIRELQDETREIFATSPYGRAYRAAGTLESIEFADALSMLPAFGWQERTFDGASSLGLDAVESAASSREQTDDTYPGDYRVDLDDYELVIRGGTPISLGAGLGFDDFDVVSALGSICDRLGIDVISAGNVVALAMIASEEERIAQDLRFGDRDRVQQLLEEIARGETELAKTLGRGVEVAANEFGLEGTIPTVKAMAVPSFDPRGAPAMALSYATSDRGACHRRSVPATVDAFRGGWSPEQLAQAVVAEQDRRGLHWCLIVDDVTDTLYTDLIQRWLAAIGASYSQKELQQIGTRTWTLTRQYNVREGIDREEDTLPSLFREGNNSIDQEFFNETLDHYYRIRNWDDRGRPTQELLDDLRLAWTSTGSQPVQSHSESDILSGTGAGE